MKKNRFKNIIELQFIVVLYSLSGIASKFASKYEFLSDGFVLCYGAEIMILGIYALIWQQVIKKTDISIAYSNKATSIFWSILWSYLIFKESVSVKNIIGIVIIFIGVLLINKYE